MDCWESLYQHVGMMSDASNETARSYVLKKYNLCVFAGKLSQESIIKEENTTLSHEGDHDKDKFQLSYAELES
jgi:hypothetical protein